MRGALLGIAFAAVVLLVGLNSAPAQAGCTMVGLTGTCEQGTIVLSWNFLCTVNCTAKVVKIERKCGPFARWEVVEEGGIPSPWKDRPPVTCPPGWYYRLTAVTECPESVSIATYQIGPIHCP